MSRILIVVVFAAGAFAQPLIYNRAVYNAASFMPPRLPGGTVAQGGIFTIFGTSLGPAKPVQASSFPLGTTLGGTSVLVKKGATTVNAIPIYVSPSQLNVIMPSNAPLGTASVRVQTGFGQSNPMTVNIGPAAFGIFTATGTGLGPGILQNYIAQDNQPINSATIAAKPGQVITLWGTGLGPVAADNVAPIAGNLPTQVELFVGGVPAAVNYSGRTPCCSGVDQIAFVVPANAPQGCWVPVYVRTGGTTVSNFVSMAITADGSSCLNSGSVPPVFGAGKYGSFVSLRVATREDVGVRSTVDVVGDYTAAVAYQTPASQFPFNPVLSAPPAGTCTTYAVKGDVLRGDTLPGAVPAGAKTLDFGAGFAISGSSGTKLLQNILAAAPLRWLGSSISSNLFSNSLYLNPGTFHIASTGGSDVGPFSVSANMPQPLAWTNRDQLTLVDRSTPLTVSWSGGSGGQVAIIGFGVDLPTDSTTIFGCLAPQGATSFSVPPIVLSNVPATRSNPLQSKSVVFLYIVPGNGTVSAFTASGLDTAFAAFQYATGKTVVFQ